MILCHGLELTDLKRLSPYIPVVANVVSKMTDWGKWQKEGVQRCSKPLPTPMPRDRLEDGVLGGSIPLSTHVANLVARGMVGYKAFNGPELALHLSTLHCFCNIMLLFSLLPPPFLCHHLHCLRCLNRVRQRNKPVVSPMKETEIKAAGDFFW